MEPLIFIKKCSDVADIVAGDEPKCHRKLIEEQWDLLKPLYDELKPKSGEQEQLDEVLKLAKQSFPIGSMVEVRWTGYTGEIVGYRSNLGGLYPAVEFPVNIKIITCTHDKFKKAIGSIFEYKLDQLFRLDFLEQAYEDVLNLRAPSISDDPEYIRCFNYWFNL